MEDSKKTYNQLNSMIDSFKNMFVQLLVKRQEETQLLNTSHLVQIV